MAGPGRGIIDTGGRGAAEKEVRVGAKAEKRNRQGQVRDRVRERLSACLECAAGDVWVDAWEEARDDVQEARALHLGMHAAAAAAGEAARVTARVSDASARRLDAASSAALDGLAAHHAGHTFAFPRGIDTDCALCEGLPVPDPHPGRRRA